MLFLLKPVTVFVKVQNRILFIRVPAVPAAGTHSFYSICWGHCNTSGEKWQESFVCLEIMQVTYFAMRGSNKKTTLRAVNVLWTYI